MAGLFISRLALTQDWKLTEVLIFSSIKMFYFFTAYNLYGSSLVKLKAEGQTVETENLIEELQYSNQNSRQSWVSLIGLWTTRPMNAWNIDGHISILQRQKEVNSADKCN